LGLCETKIFPRDLLFKSNCCTSAFANTKTRALEKDELNKKAEENDKQNKEKYKGKTGRSNEFKVNDMILAKNRKLTKLQPLFEPTQSSR
jgi:hypothetical protein